jgi:serine/threonine protein kinase
MPGDGVSTRVDTDDDATVPAADVAAPGVGAPPRGTAIDRFLVIDALGHGGMGVVVAAYDPTLDRKVALKLVRAYGGSTDASSRARARLLREAQAMARLSHPNVITVYEVGTYGGQVFIAMELVEGGTLGAWMRERPRGAAEVIDVVGRAGRGLAAAHAVGLVHRDFKPDNVLVGRDGSVRVTDFGLVRRDGGPDDEGSVGGAGAAAAAAVSQTLTRPGALMGTPLYMAPEQHRGERSDARADQFAFCVVLYEALYGQRPFVAADDEAPAAAVLAGALRPPPRGARVPARLRRAVERGLATAPESRHPSMAALLGELERARGAGRWRVAALGAAALALAAVAVLARGTTTRAPPYGPGSWPRGCPTPRRRPAARRARSMPTRPTGSPRGARRARRPPSTTSSRRRRSISGWPASTAASTTCARPRASSPTPTRAWWRGRSAPPPRCRRSTSAATWSGWPSPRRCRAILPCAPTSPRSARAWR